MAKSRKQRRFEKLNKLKAADAESTISETEKVTTSRKEKEYPNVFAKIYETQYKKLLLIPFILLILAFVVIGMNVVQTGDFINRGISLKGGLELTIPLEEQVDIIGLESYLAEGFPEHEVEVRELSGLGSQNGINIKTDISLDQRDDFISTVETKLGITDTNSYSKSETGSNLGSNFFKQTMIAVLLAFVFMGLVVFWYFRTFVISAAVILASFSDIVITLAVVDLLGIKLGTAGIAAFLMLIGYSVDTDILLSTRVLKRTEGTVMGRVYGAMRTGLTMNLTTIVAVTIALIVSDSETITQIMTIILIGLFADIINTWIQNVGIIRYYLERKKSE